MLHLQLRQLCRLVLQLLGRLLQVHHFRLLLFPGSQGGIILISWAWAWAKLLPVAACWLNKCSLLCSLEAYVLQESGKYNTGQVGSPSDL